VRDVFNPSVASRKRTDDLLREAREEVAALRRRLWAVEDALSEVERYRFDAPMPADEWGRYVVARVRHAMEVKP
jgi:hypothetical protein